MNGKEPMALRTLRAVEAERISDGRYKSNAKHARICIGHGAFVDGVAVENAFPCGRALGTDAPLWGKRSPRCEKCRRLHASYIDKKSYERRGKVGIKPGVCEGIMVNGVHHPCTTVIDKRRGGRIRCHACVDKHEIQRNRERNRIRYADTRKKDRERKAEQVKAIPGRVVVRHGNQHSAPAHTLRKAQPKCEECCDLCERRPHAPERCKCKLSWSAEVIERPSLLVSNGGRVWL